MWSRSSISPTPLGALGPGHLLLAEAEFDVGLHVHVGEEGVGLEHHVNRPTIGRDVGDIHAVDPDAATGGAVQPRQQTQQGGLATAGPPQERKELALIDIQADAVEGMNLAKETTSRPRYAHKAWP
jgi:hypothetical protein